MKKILCYMEKNKIEVISVVLISVFALVLRIINLINFGEIWNDELFSWYFASRDYVFSTASELLKTDIHMPLYFILLHFWLKIVGKYNIEGMRVLSLLLSFPLVPLSFYFVKKIFNKTAAYFAMIYLSINTFCIYYSSEVRFYSMTLVLSVMIAYFFVKMTENFNKKDTIFYITSACLLFYTFSIAPLLIFTYFICGLIYLYFKKREFIKKFINVNIIIFLISLPAIACIFSNVIAMHSALTYYPLDNYKFDARIINDIFENFFALENIQILYSNTIFYRNILENIQNIPYFCFVFVPIVIALFSLCKALFSKNEKLYLFLVPSLVFLAIMLILGVNNMAVVQTRYLTVIFPVVICSIFYGITTFKSEIITIPLFIMFILLNGMNILFSEGNIFSLHRVTLSELRQVFDYNIKLKDDDYVVDPFNGNIIKFYAKKGNIVPFNLPDAFVLKNRASTKFYLGDNYKKYTRDNIKRRLHDYIINDRIIKVYEKNLYENYIKNLKSGQRVIFIVFYSHLINKPAELGINEETYRNYNLIALLYSKVLRDTYLILNKYLKETETYDSTEHHKVIVFVKE